MDGGATSQAGHRCPRARAEGKGTLSDAFHDVSARNNVVNAHREPVQGAHKQAKAMDKTLRQVMWRKLGSTGRKIATDYLSGTTFILTNDRKHDQTTRIPRVDRCDLALNHQSFFDAPLAAGLKHHPGNKTSGTLDEVSLRLSSVVLSEMRAFQYCILNVGLRLV
jgi:hypothetical protein